jgi:hypothetical protein
VDRFVAGLIRNEIVILGTAGDEVSLAESPTIGYHVPFKPPYGSSSIANASEEAIEGWLSKACIGDLGQQYL